jgi:adenylosuccinate lyase
MRKSLAQAGIPLTPLDGRYRNYVLPIVDYLSEAALNRERVNVEVEWFIKLLDVLGLDGGVGERSCAADRAHATPTPLPAHEPAHAALPAHESAHAALPAHEPAHADLRKIVDEFDENSVAKLKELESVTQHDVKAIEYYVKDCLAGTDLEKYSELVHFCCTSEDINNLSYALAIKHAMENVWIPKAKELVADVQKIADDCVGIPMLSLTHGQPATPTTLGKEFAVFAHRLRRQLRRIETQDYLGKINGATGTFGAHTVAYPEVDWIRVSKEFVESLGLVFNPLTTQIESHDWQVELFSELAHFGGIAHNLATDVWMYISLGRFTQIPVKGATGSSTMPHKVNPIKFENAEANFEISGALLESLSRTLVTSRMQRDLTDSSTQRNISAAIGHSLLALCNIVAGLGALSVNEKRLDEELRANWEVLAEPIQIVLKRAVIEGASDVENPYELLKELTRGKTIDEAHYREIISELNLPEKYLSLLRDLTPQTYTGIAEKLTEGFV